MFFLELDQQAAAHVAAALSSHFHWARDNGYRPPPELLDLADRCLKGARGGQAGTAVDAIADRADAAPVTALLLSYRQAAAVLGVSVRTITRLVAAGELPSVHVGGIVRIRREDVESYVASLASRHLADRIEHKGQGVA